MESTDKSSQEQTNTHYMIVDHMEPGLSLWTLSEYQQMSRYLKNTKIDLIITGCASFLKPELEDEESIECFKQLIEFLKTTEMDQRLTFISKPLIEMRSTENPDEFHLRTQKNDKVVLRHQRICLMDMRTNSQLKCQDKDTFDAFLFGGILGNHPPQDRTKALRDIGFDIRQLGETQMSTDGALLATAIVIDHQRELTDIPFIMEPELKKSEDETEAQLLEPSQEKGEVMTEDKAAQETVQMEGFVYVSNEYDYEAKKIVPVQQKKPLMHEDIMNTLLFMDFDIGELLAGDPIFDF